MNLFFDAFETFTDDGYNIDEIHFEYPDPEHGEPAHSREQTGNLREHFRR